jgi:hypothetical protein
MEDSAAASYEDQGRATAGTEVPHGANVTDISDAPQPRLVGSPLPGGGGSYVAPPAAPAASHTDPTWLSSPQAAPRQPARALPAPPPSGLQRAVNALRVAIPYFQKILPLLDGNLATTVSNILTPPKLAAPPAPPAPDLAPMIAPIKQSLAELQVQQRDLKDQFIEQNASLKRVEDHLEMVREATDRNTLEQQELLEDLKNVGSKVNVVAVIAIGLLAISVLLNMLLYLHIQRILP